MRSRLDRFHERLSSASEDGMRSIPTLWRRDASGWELNSLYLCFIPLNSVARSDLNQKGRIYDNYPVRNETVLGSTIHCTDLPAAHFAATERTGCWSNSARHHQRFRRRGSC